MDDSKERTDAFKNECLELVKKYECDFMTYPFFIPSDDGSFRIGVTMQIVDKRTLPAISPLQKNDILP